MPDRTIKETIRTSKNVNNLTDFQFRLWVYLITFVDDKGAGSADPEILKSLVFPRKPSVTRDQILNALERMESFGMIKLFEENGEPCFCFPKFAAHQDLSSLSKRFVPPTLDEVKEYVKQRQSKVDPVKFFEYFTVSGWRDSEGKPVKNWKQKLITWEKFAERSVGNGKQPKSTNCEKGKQWEINYDF